MSLIQTLAIVMCLAALFGHVNYRLLKRPMAIGLMAVALEFAVELAALGELGFEVGTEAQRLIGAIDFNETLMHGILGGAVCRRAARQIGGTVRSQVGDRAPSRLSEHCLEYCSPARLSVY